LRDLLKAELEQHDLWPLAQEDFQMACNPLGPATRTESPTWVRLRRRRDLAPRDLTVLLQLLAWRDETAARSDRPPFKVLDEERLVEIARAKPSTLGDLLDAGLGARRVEQWGTDVLEAVARGLVSPLLEHARPTTPTRAFMVRFEKLKQWRKETAVAMDVESDVVLPRGLLLALAENGPQDLASIMKSSPWRLMHFGDQISNVLQTAAS
jgi:ribonuclease D